MCGNAQSSSLGARTVLTKKNKFQYPFIAPILRTTDLQYAIVRQGNARLSSDSEETFHLSPTLRGSCNVVEVISPSRGKGKGNQCAIPASYLVLNGVTIHTTCPCEYKG